MLLLTWNLMLIIVQQKKKNVWVTNSSPRLVTLGQQSKATWAKSAHAKPVSFLQTKLVWWNLERIRSNFAKVLPSLSLCCAHIILLCSDHAKFWTGEDALGIC